MKKLTFILTALFLFAGLAQAQDVYFIGNNGGIGKIWKNNMLIHSINDTTLVHLSAMQVANDGSIYSAGYSHDSTYDDVRGLVWLNDSVVFTADTNTAIFKMTFNGGQWTAAGVGQNEWENTAGLVWQDGELLYSYSDTLLNNQITALAIDTVIGDIYTGGNSSELEARATVWKNDTVLWREDSLSAINALAFDGTDLYAAGYLDYEGWKAALWQNGTLFFSVSGDDAEFSALSIYNGSVYLGGYNENTLYIWQDDEVLYDHAFTENSHINVLIVNEFGVYYAGQINGIATIWKDGEILYQPEDCDEITDLVVLPSPTLYTITVESGNPDWGTVSGGGSYPYGDTIQIEAIPNVGHEFLGWNDGSLDNPRDIVVTQDSTFIASFAVSQFTITVESDFPAWGSVTGGGTFYYGDTIEIAANSNLGFEFVNWTDGNTDNPRTIIVTESQTYTAHFGIQQCLIKTEVIPEGAGTVNGGGTYDYGTIIHLTAHSNTGYVFSQWNDGNITNPRSVFVEGNAVYTAVFTPLQYEITTDCDPVEGGTVTGAGTYDYGSTVTLTATPNEYYMFLCWNDGIVTNPRDVTITGNASYTALFYLVGTQQYTVTVTANDPTLGTVTGSGTYIEGATAQISAAPIVGAVFMGWNDGNTDNPRNIIVTQNMTFTAIFERQQNHLITVTSSNPLWGSVIGGGTFPSGSTIAIEAIPNQDYYFAGWQDDNFDNPRYINVTSDSTFIALFSEVPVQFYSVVVQYDETQGYIIGAGEYLVNSTVDLTAIPYDGYHFVKWGDGITDNPRRISVTQDMTFAAFFNINTDVEENGHENVILYPNPTNGVLHLEGIEAGCEINIYNSFGTCVMCDWFDGDEISVEKLPAGLYLLQIDGKHTMRFVKR